VISLWIKKLERPSNVRAVCERKRVRASPNLVFRSTTEPFEGFPLNGFLLITLEETAKRELFEETGLTAHSLELFGIFSGKAERRDNERQIIKNSVC